MTAADLQTLWNSVIAALPKLIATFASGGQTSWIIGGVITLLFGIGGYFLNNWFKSQANAAAQQANQQDQSQSQTDNAQQNQSATDATDQADQNLNNIIQQGEAPNGNSSPS